MTQTAIEWLIEEINKQKAWANPEKLEPLIEQAKEMEKQQVIMACNQQEFQDIDCLGICETISKGQQYYEETYGGNNAE